MNPSKPMKLIYLASPYTSRHPRLKYIIEDSREKQINRIGAQLQSKHKVAIFPPITISAIYKRLMPDRFGTEFKDWQEVDLCAISHCDELWVVKMKGWDESVGVCAEIDFARQQNIPIRYVDPDTLKLTLEYKPKSL